MTTSDETVGLIWAGATMQGAPDDPRMTNPLERRRIEAELEAERRRVAAEALDRKVAAEDRADRLAHQARLVAAATGHHSIRHDRRTSSRTPSTWFSPTMRGTRRALREAGGILAALPTPAPTPAAEKPTPTPLTSTQKKARAFGHRLIHGKGNCMCPVCTSVRVADREQS